MSKMHLSSILPLAVVSCAWMAGPSWGAVMAARNAPSSNSLVPSVAVSSSGAHLGPSCGIATSSHPPSASSASPPAPSGSNVSGSKKYVAYWGIWSAPTVLPTDNQLRGLTHLILSFVDVSLTEEPHWAKGAAVFTVDNIKAIQDKGIKVMVAVGGWNLDVSFRPAASSQPNRELFASKLVGFVKQFNLDGVDLDWEYPVWNGESYKQDPVQFPATARPRNDADGPNFVLLAQEIRKRLDAYGTETSRDVTMSIAVPSKYEDTLAYQVPDTVKGLDKEVDFWNLMSYDFMNRRNNATTHHAGGSVIAQTIQIYQDMFDIAPQRLLFGFPMYAKWFTVKPGCNPPYMNCEGELWEDPTTGEDLNTSGTVTFNTAVTENADAVKAWENVSQDAHRDMQNVASAWVDGTRFWTWLSKEDVLQACKANIDKVGGVFHWSINQDNRASDGGDHIDAIQACLGI